MNYWKIDTDDMCNGCGLRIVLWLSGCSHRCKGCQNPQTWDANGGMLFDKNAEDKLFREIDKSYISGLTLSGGDPLCETNLSGVLCIVSEFNKRYKKEYNIHLSLPKKTIWLYTGYRLEDCLNNPLRNEVVSKCDIVVDGEYIDSLKDYTAHWRGSTNQRIWRNNNGTWVDVTSVM